MLAPLAGDRVSLTVCFYLHAILIKILIYSPNLSMANMHGNVIKLTYQNKESYFSIGFVTSGPPTTHEKHNLYKLVRLTIIRQTELRVTLRNLLAHFSAKRNTDSKTNNPSMVAYTQRKITRWHHVKMFHIFPAITSWKTHLVSRPPYLLRVYFRATHRNSDYIYSWDG